MEASARTELADLPSLSEKRSRTVHGILGAAMTIVVEDGVAGLSMSAIAQRAEVSRQTLYIYFADVEAVLAGMVTMGDEGVAELAEEVLAEGDPRLALELFADVVVASGAAGHPSPAALAAALPASLRDAVAAHARRTEGLVIEVLRRGRDGGSFRSDLEPGLDGRLLYRVALAAADLAAEPDTDQGLLSQRLKTALLRMVAAEGSTRAGS